MRADQGRGRTFHGRPVERFRQVPDIRSLERIGDRRVPDSVLIRLGAGAEPGMKVALHLGYREHSDIGWKLCIERALQGRHVVFEVHDDAGHLTECVNTSIRAARAVHDDARTLKSGERLLEQFLHGVAFGLSLPADKARPVVREGQLEGSL